MILILLDVLPVDVPLAGETLLPPRHLFTGRPRRRDGGAKAGVSIGHGNIFVLSKERDYRALP